MGYERLNLNDGDVLKAEHIAHLEEGLSNIATLSEDMVNQYDTVADMLNANLRAGMVAFTRGYHSIGDGGEGKYFIVTNEIANGLDILTLENGNYAVLDYGDEIRVTQCGFASDDNVDAFVRRFNGVAKRIDFNLKSVQVSDTIVINDVTELYSSVRGCVSKTWGPTSAVFSTIPYGDGCTPTEQPKMLKNVRIHDLYIYGSKAKACVVLAGINSGHIDNLKVESGDIGFLLGNIWCTTIGNLMSVAARKFGFYVPSIERTEHVDFSLISNGVVENGVNAVTFQNLTASHSGVCGVYAEAPLGECVINAIAIETIPAGAVGAKMYGFSGTINTIHCESDSTDREYDVYFDTFGSLVGYGTDEDYMGSRSLFIGQMRARRVFLNGEITVGNIYVCSYPQQYVDGGEYRRFPVRFDTGNRPETVKILAAPSKTPLTVQYEDFEMPYGIVGIHPQIPEYKMADKMLKNIMSVSPMASTTLTSATRTITVPDDALPYARIKKLYGNTVLNHQVVENGNFETLDGWDNSAYNCSMVASGNELQVTRTVDETSVYAYQVYRNTTALKDAHKYYLRFDVYAPHTMNVKIMATTPTAWPAARGSAVANAWTTVSGVITMTGDSTQLTVSFDAQSSNGYVVGDVIKVRNVMAVDLTAGFTTEPALEELDAMYAEYIAPGYTPTIVNRIASSAGDELSIPKAIWTTNRYGSNPPRLYYEGIGENNPEDTSVANVLDFDAQTYTAYGKLVDNAWEAFDAAKVYDLTRILSPDNLVKVKPGGTITFETDNNADVKSEVVFYNHST